MAKRYRLEFEYISPFTGKWMPAAKEVDEADLPGLKQQLENQLLMPDVRKSRILSQEIGPWEEITHAA